jgi:hypothetical protein
MIQVKETDGWIILDNEDLNGLYSSTDSILAIR